MNGFLDRPDSLCGTALGKYRQWVRVLWCLWVSGLLDRLRQGLSRRGVDRASRACHVISVISIITTTITGIMSSVSAASKAHGRDWLSPPGATNSRGRRRMD
ncbi:hypothetical protein BJX63DRAFT_355428 [Aspergillus granulosus]|uniref:Uncharacterized protein n=1 Tax=Aspergillus granulosus TaxID=176169 RepID=A0ABR4H1Z9_9EURO